MPRHELTDKELRERYERNQARVGLASNAVGLTAGVAALGTAVRDPRLKSAGKVGQAVYRAGQKVVPQPINNRLNRMMYSMNPKTRRKAAKIGGGLALGAVGLQGANTAGDLVANRVLTRESEMGKSLNFSDGASVGRRLTEVSKSVMSAAKLASSGPETVRRTHALVSQDSINQARWARKAAKGKQKIASTTPAERRATHLGRSDLAARARAVDEARAARLATGSSTGTRMAGETAAEPSRTRSFLRRAAPYGVAGVGGGVAGYQLAKSDRADRATPEFARIAKADRERLQGVAIGGGAAGAGVLSELTRRQFGVFPVQDRGKNGQLLKPRENAAIGLKAPSQGASPKKAALLAAGALGSGAVATAAAKRSRKKEARTWR